MAAPETPLAASDHDQPRADRPPHAPADHPAVPRGKVGVVLANLGTPDATDYWSMRRYLSEFLSDKRVVDYPDWKNDVNSAKSANTPTMLPKFDWCTVCDDTK